VSDGDTPVSAADVGQLFKGEGPWPSDYHERVKGLAFLPLRGFVKGFIDLIVEHEGRFYVLDYKTNFVGETYDEYGGTALADVMATDHYFIQYHLYALALVRWLRLRLADFAYERHFGGIFYLFVRGMAPQFGARCGVFFHRPSEDAIEAWSSTLAGRPGAWGHHRAPRGATKGER
jgi:exodeoxyribonuclease V beta subunit